MVVARGVTARSSGVEACTPIRTPRIQTFESASEGTAASEPHFCRGLLRLRCRRARRRPLPVCRGRFSPAHSSAREGAREGEHTSASAPRSRTPCRSGAAAFPARGNPWCCRARGHGGAGRAHARTAALQHQAVTTGRDFKLRQEPKTATRRGPSGLQFSSSIVAYPSRSIRVEVSESQRPSCSVRVAVSDPASA